MLAETDFGGSDFVGERAGEEEAIWYLGTLMVRKAGWEANGGAFDLIESRAAPGASPPWHIHHREDEFFYVLEGRATYYVGDRVIPAEQGAFVWLPRGIAHTFRIEGEQPARLLEIVAPSGLWEFFKEMGEPALECTVPPLRLPDPGRLRTVAARYGIEILRPFNG